MNNCKNCKNFKPMENDGTKGYCYGHLASLQIVESEKEAKDCPVNKFIPKE